MLLKTYRGPDLATTLKRIRRELGPNALVLGTSEHKKRFGMPVVEVTVAAPRDRESARQPDGEVKALAAEIHELKSKLGRSPEPAPVDRRRPSRSSTFCHITVERLIAAGLDPDLAERFGRISARDRSTPPADVVTREIANVLDFVPLPLSKRCLFVIGPPGAGKTTTVAKLASRVCRPDRPVVFGVADTERIGSFEQAEIYCRYIGSRARRIEKGDDLHRAIDNVGERGIVLVDTTGIAAGDRTRRQALRLLVNAVSDAEIAVLLPAGLHHVEARRVLDRFSEFRPTCAAWSRIDDSERPGELLSALAGRRIPLSFVTTGHAVPDDLEPASPQSVADLLLRSGAEAAPRTEVRA